MGAYNYNLLYINEVYFIGVKFLPVNNLTITVNNKEIDRVNGLDYLRQNRCILLVITTCLIIA